VGTIASRPSTPHYPMTNLVHDESPRTGSVTILCCATRLMPRYVRIVAALGAIKATLVTLVTMESSRRREKPAHAVLGAFAADSLQGVMSRTRSL